MKANIYYLQYRGIPNPRQTKNAIVIATSETEARSFLKTRTRDDCWVNTERADCTELGKAKASLKLGVFDSNRGSYGDALALAGA